MSLNTRLLILDKDGTLVKPKSGSQFVQRPEDQELLPGVAERVKEYAEAGWKIAIASNQGGVAAGYKTLESAIEEMQYCLKLLPEIYLGLLCPDSGETFYRVRKLPFSSSFKVSSDNTFEYITRFRKPDPGMLLYALLYDVPLKDHLSIDKRKNISLMVGDRPEDEEAAVNAGIPFMDAEQWRSISYSQVVY